MKKLLAEFSRQLEIIRKLPPKQKAEHIWEYYHAHILVLIAVIMVLVSIVEMIQSNGRKMLVQGVILNNSIPAEGFEQLSDGYWEFCGADPNQRVELIGEKYADLGSEYPSESESSVLTLLSVLVSNGDLDVILTDEESLFHLRTQGIVSDLRQLLPQEYLQSLDTVELEGAILGIRLDGTSFARKYPFSRENACVLVPTTVRQPERATQFLSYLLSDRWA